MRFRMQSVLINEGESQACRCVLRREIIYLTILCLNYKNHINTIKRTVFCVSKNVYQPLSTPVTSLSCWNNIFVFILQVFAKRIGDILLSNQSNNNSKKFAAENALKTYLLQEVKHISSLIGNYIDDSAFNGVQFSLLHHRLATRIVSYLLDYPEKLSDVCKDLEGLLDT